MFGSLPQQAAPHSTVLPECSAQADDCALPDSCGLTDRLSGSILSPSWFVMNASPEAVLGRFSSAVILKVLEAEAPAEQTVQLALRLGGLRLTGGEAAALLAVWTRIESWAVAQVDRAIVGVAGPESTADDWGREEAALCMRLSPVTAIRRVEHARLRCGQFAIVGKALESAVLLPTMAFDLHEALLPLPDDVADMVCHMVIPGAGEMTRAEFGKAVRKAVIACDPDGAAARHVEAKNGRCVRIKPAPDGMADMYARLTAVEAQTLYQALDGTARRDIAAAAVAARAIDPTVPAPRIPLDHARADALVAWAQTALADPTLPRAQGRAADICIVMTMPTVVGLRDDPAYLVGYGPITAEVARELLPGGKLRRLVTDPVTGHLLDVGQRSYEPPQALKDFVVTRDPTCILRGCSRASRHCDLDHREPFPAGSTSADNMAPLCRRHHLMKHTGGWQLRKSRGGDLYFLSAAGRHYAVNRPSVDPSFVAGSVASLDSSLVSGSLASPVPGSPVFGSPVFGSPIVGSTAVGSTAVNSFFDSAISDGGDVDERLMAGLSPELAQRVRQLMAGLASASECEPDGDDYEPPFFTKDAAATSIQVFDDDEPPF